LSDEVEFDQLLAKLPNTPLPTIAAAVSNFDAQNRARNTQELQQVEEEIQFFEGNTANQPPQQLPIPHTIADGGYGKDSAFKGKPFPVSKEADFAERGKRYQSAAQQTLFKQRQQQQQIGPNAESPFDDAEGVNGIGLPVEQVGVSRPVWVGERLLLARRVDIDGETVVQGSWLDWPQIKKRLLAEATDLLPQADLVAVDGNAEADPGRMLAGLPVRIVVGESAVASVVGPTLQWALWMGWGAVVLATAAAAALLNGVMTLSERRAAFVSSVTHELRTPLTTFRMYAEMLARGMVPDAARRQEYFDTLQREAERLTLLVENVLAYARLERGRKPHALEGVSLERLFDRVGSRLAHRAQQAGMQCDVQVEADAGGHEFTTDLNVVEQILFNLVDNAAKYARDATDRRIHVEANRNGQWTRLTVRDHGPGIEQRRLSRRLQAFGKSAQDSAESAPGVGLGLALCGRLARELGGRLEFRETPGGGASVTLVLPS
jgi:signal transduction histidine kinase